MQVVYVAVFAVAAEIVKSVGKECKTWDITQRSDKTSTSRAAVAAAASAAADLMVAFQMHQETDCVPVAVI